MTRFAKSTLSLTPIVDNVFVVVDKAQQAKKKYGDKVIDATIGSLYDEEGQLVAFSSVFDSYDAMDDRIKAKYAQSFSGNPSYREQVYNWVVKDTPMTLQHSVIATPGGSGAISVTLQTIVEEGQSVLIPNLAWGSYKLMCEMFNLKVKTYELFEENHFNLQDFKKKCEDTIAEEGKLTVIINDPCHNPSGYSLTTQEWKQVIDILNECSTQGPVTVLNDIAYIDYAREDDKSRAYMETFNNISENVLIVVAFSCSKTMTSYGLRCGAVVLLAQTAEVVREVEIVMEKDARAIWSNVPNAAMENFVQVTTKGYEVYKKEKDFYVDILTTRSDIFRSEADAVGLEYYPYKEGFFVTLKVEDDSKKQKFHEALMQQHIYTVAVYKGIRIALCSLSIDKCKGLAKKIADIYHEV